MLLYFLTFDFDIEKTKNDMNLESNAVEGDARLRTCASPRLRRALLRTVLLIPFMSPGGKKGGGQPFFPPVSGARRTTQLLCVACLFGGTFWRQRFLNENFFEISETTNPSPRLHDGYCQRLT